MFAQQAAVDPSPGARTTQGGQILERKIGWIFVMFSSYNAGALTHPSQIKRYFKWS